MKYGILGSGSANPKVVQDCLADIVSADNDAVFVVHARRKPQGAVGSIYDFLVDNECAFHIVRRVDDNAPKILIEKSRVDQTYDDPAKYIINVSDEILLLWDEENEEASQSLAIMADNGGKPVKDITMALAPITFKTADAPEEIPVVVDQETGSVATFTREEMEGMSIASLRRHAKALGLDMSSAKKDEI